MNSIYILYDTYQPATAGTNHLLAYAKGLAEHGVCVTVFYLCPDKELSKIDDSANLHHVYLWEQQRTKKYNKYSTSLFSLFRFMRLMKKDIPVFIMGVSIFLPLVCAKRGFKIYHERTEHPEVSGRMHGLIGNILFARYKKILLKLDGLFVISNNLRQCFINDYGLDAQKVHVINMVVDSERFWGLTKHHTERYIAYCGTASNNKDGVDQLIKAYAITARQFPDVKLWIIGKTPDKGQEFANKQLVQELGIEEKVNFTGIIPSEQIPQVLMNAEILALDRPNNLQAKHGFPTKLGEYLLTGNPVAVTKVGDIPLFLQDGISAVLAEPDKPEEFASKLNWLLEHPEEGRKIGDAGKKVALREFNYLIESKKLYNHIFGNL